MLEIATDGLCRCPPLSSDRLSFEPLCEEDLGAIVYLLSDYETVLLLTYAPWPYTVSDAIQWFAHVDRMCAMNMGCFWGIHDGEGTFIGTAGLSLFPEHEKGELHYWLGKAHWGKGYGTEIARRIIRYYFEILQFKRLEVNHMVRNVRSQRVIEKCGFKFEGLMRSYVKRFTAFEDVKFYSLLDEEFAQSAIESVGGAVEKVE